jgi:hypothetical protein
MKKHLRSLLILRNPARDSGGLPFLRKIGPLEALKRRDIHRSSSRAPEVTLIREFHDFCVGFLQEEPSIASGR